MLIFLFSRPVFADVDDLYLEAEAEYMVGRYKETIKILTLIYRIEPQILLRGEFDEQITIKEEVHIIGGWNDLWHIQGRTVIRPTHEKMDVSEPWAALIGKGHSSKNHTTIANLEIRAPDAAENEMSSYGIFLDEAWVSFINIEAFGGTGGDGKDGEKGKDGAVGSHGLTPTNTQGSNVVPVGVSVNFYSRTPWPKDAAVNNNCPKDTVGGKGGLVSNRIALNGIEGGPVSFGPVSFDHEVGAASGFLTVISDNGTDGANGFGGGGGGDGVFALVDDHGPNKRTQRHEVLRLGSQARLY